MKVGRASQVLSTTTDIKGFRSGPRRRVRRRRGPRPCSCPPSPGSRRPPAAPQSRSMDRNTCSLLSRGDHLRLSGPGLHRRRRTPRCQATRRERAPARPHTERPARLVRSCQTAHRSPRLPSRRNWSSARRFGRRIVAGHEVGAIPPSNGKTVWALLGNEAADLQLAVGEHGG